ncbi:MAG TPA: DoxX family membrane protein, partial [Rhodothermales bacterium]|nr:DoxX family membrane protein [Rhodothermales bacterium]
MRWSRRLVPLLLLAFVPAPAWAHVKWFSRFSFADRPLTAGEVVTPTFLALALLSVVAIGALVVLDRRLAQAAWYRRIGTTLDAYRDRSPLVLRVATGAVLLLNWQADAMLVPELPASAAWVGWFQFALVLLLLFQKTVPLAGVGLAVLYGLGIARFGPFHMLDYLFLSGFAVYFMVSNTENAKVRALGLPALYATVGFSLCWVALEKLVYPDWGLYVLEQNPMLSLGFPIAFFLVGAAFVELALGYLLIIGLLERPFALLITLVFFTTTLVFGKLEVIGHTMLHAALVVFLLEGTGGVYRPPVRLHERPALRVAFAAVNFAVLLAVLLVPYTLGAR